MFLRDIGQLAVHRRSLHRRVFDHRRWRNRQRHRAGLSVSSERRQGPRQPQECEGDKGQHGKVLHTWMLKRKTCERCEHPTHCARQLERTDWRSVANFVLRGRYQSAVDARGRCDVVH